MGQAPGVLQGGEVCVGGQGALPRPEGGRRDSPVQQDMAFGCKIKPRTI